MEEKGCTANVLLVVPEDPLSRTPTTLYCANAGDSRSVACIGGKAQGLSFDHKPTNPSERQRIQRAGGFVNGEGRVNGNLNLSRALGDLTYKKNKRVQQKDQIISAFPDVRVQPLGKIEFIVMGCDGIWEFHTNQQVVEAISLQMQRKVKLPKIAEGWLDTCLSPNITRTMGKVCDNMSTILIDFRK